MNTRSKALVVLPVMFLANLALLMVTTLQRLEHGGMSTIAFDWGLVPDRLTDAIQSGSLVDIAYNLSTLVTCAFLHGGLEHFISNMILLVIVGRIVEDEFGSWRFLFVYMLSGIGASVTHYVFNATSGSNLIGASGAVSGIMGAFLVMLFLRPWRRNILTIIGGFYILFWSVEQVISAVSGPAQGEPNNIAYLAHIGGLLFGIVLTFLASLGDKKEAQENDDDLFGGRGRSHRFIGFDQPAVETTDVTILDEATDNADGFQKEPPVIPPVDETKDDSK